MSAVGVSASWSWSGRETSVLVNRPRLCTKALTSGTALHELRLPRDALTRTLGDCGHSSWSGRGAELGRHVVTPVSKPCPGPISSAPGPCRQDRAADGRVDRKRWEPHRGEPVNLAALLEQCFELYLACSPNFLDRGLCVMDLTGHGRPIGGLRTHGCIRRQPLPWSNAVPSSRYVAWRGADATAVGASCHWATLC